MIKDSIVSTRINSFATAQEKAKQPATGKLEDYITFIETNLKDTPLSALFPNDHKQSIFFDNGNSLLPGENKLSPKMLKYVLRAYLTGNTILSGTGDTAGEVEKNAFLKNHALDLNSLQNKKLADILDSVNTIRKN